MRIHQNNAGKCQFSKSGITFSEFIAPTMMAFMMAKAVKSPPVHSSRFEEFSPGRRWNCWLYDKRRMV
jgi:hypothetical protein